MDQSKLGEILQPFADMDEATKTLKGVAERYALTMLRNDTILRGIHGQVTMRERERGVVYALPYTLLIGMSHQQRVLNLVKAALLATHQEARESLLAEIGNEGLDEVLDRFFPGPPRVIDPKEVH